MTVSTLDRTDAASETTDATPLASRAPTQPAARRRLPFWCRTTLGIAVGVSALVIPWIGLNLSADWTAFDIKLSFGAVPVVGHLNYGDVLLAIVATVVVSTVRSRGRPTNVTRACGWAMILVPLLFVATTRIMGGEVLFRLSNDLAQTQIVDRQLGYRFAPPPSYLGFRPDSTTMMVLNSLQVGWYLTVLGGVLLAGRLPKPVRHRKLSVIALVAIGLLLVAGFTTGMLAETAKFDGVAAEQVGHPLLAEQDFQRALSLNPELRYDNELEVELGQAQADQAEVNGLTWLAAAEDPPPTTVALNQQIFDFTQALAADPENPVIRSDFAVTLAGDMNSSDAPLAPGSVSKLGGLPFLLFTSGHFAYEAGDESSAIAYLNQTVADTDNGELLSAAYTYLGLSEQRIGDPRQFRQDIVKAVGLDSQDINAVAREVAAGLLTPGTL